MKIISSSVSESAEKESFLFAPVSTRQMGELVSILLLMSASSVVPLLGTGVSGAYSPVLAIHATVRSSR